MQTAGGDPLTAELAAAFRVDVAEIEVELDYRPSASHVDGSAEIRFRMRPGQDRPVFHFNPLRDPRDPDAKLLTALELDGEALDPANANDLHVLRTVRTAERGFEIERSLGAGEHTLRARW